ncbi:MAG: HYC_CC_PP family protein [Bacteroidota bacterium]
MRKLTFSLVVAVYLLLSSGIVVQLHFCMDRLAAIGLFTSDHQATCDDCGMDMDEENDCCHDQTDVIRLVQDQAFYPIPNYPIKHFSAEPIRPAINLTCEVLNKNVDARLLTIPPDILSGRYRYRSLAVFRI